MISPLTAVRRVPRRTWVRYRFVFIVLAPVMLLFTYLRIVPTGQALLMSFFDWALIKPADKFVGIDNYVNLLGDDNFRLAFTNTTIFAVATTIFSVLIALVLAALLARFVTGKLGGALELLYFAPVLVPMVPVTLGWREIFNYQHGILNSTLGIVGIPKQPWLSDPTMALVAVVILSVWKQVGYNMIILLVGMRAIPHVYHEAAACDGAGAWQQFRHITMPLLAPVTLFVVVITTISAYNVFTQVYVLASDVQGAPGQARPGARLRHLRERVPVLQHGLRRRGGDVPVHHHPGPDHHPVPVPSGVQSVNTRHSVVGRVVYWVVAALLTIGGIIMVFPLFWLFSTSLRPATELLIVPPPLLPQEWTIANYQKVFDSAPMLEYLWNSVVFASLSTVFILLTSTMAGYIFAKFRFPGNNFLFMLVLATAIVPFEIYMVPLFLQMNTLGLVNNPIGLFLPYLVLSYGIFFMRQNTMTSVPDELLDAARIDGMGEFGIMLRLVPRLLAPAMAALAILAFIQAWTAFIWPLLILNDPKYFPMELGLSQFANSTRVDFGAVSAAAVFAMLPTLIAFLLLRRRIVEGITLTGLKG